MEQRLSQAAIEGSITSLHELLREDSSILERVDHVGRFNTTTLHVAASHGHLDFVKELLLRNPDLADIIDSQKRLALHLASAKGHIEVVKELVSAKGHIEDVKEVVSANREIMCRARDIDGRNPLHVAAIKGQDKVLEELVRASPNAARVRVDQGETILHLCVKYDQLDALKLLMEKLKSQDLVNAKDSRGNTILHLAVVGQQYKIVEYITGCQKLLDVNATNADGHTALDIVLQSETKQVNNADGHTALDIVLQSETKQNKDMEITIEDFLHKAGAKRAKDLVQGTWLTEKRDALIYVATVIATIAFQAGVSPPSGVWQSDEDNHRAGETVMAYNYPHYFPYFLRANTTGFVASLSIILLLSTGLPFHKRGFMWMLVVIMWLTITSMAFTYAFSIVVITPKKDRESLSSTILVAVIVWCSVMAILLVFHTIRLVAKIVEERKIKSMAAMKIFKCGLCFSNSIRGSNDNV